MPFPSFRTPTLFVVRALSVSVVGAERPPPEIALHLLRLTPDSAVLGWVTPDERRSEGTLTSVQDRRPFNDPSPARFHRQVFEALRPATTYRYAVDDVFTGTFRPLKRRTSFASSPTGIRTAPRCRTTTRPSSCWRAGGELRPELVLHTGDTTWFATYAELHHSLYVLEVLDYVYRRAATSSRTPTAPSLDGTALLTQRVN